METLPDICSVCGEDIGHINIDKDEYLVCHHCETKINKGYNITQWSNEVKYYSDVESVWQDRWELIKDYKEL